MNIFAKVEIFAYICNNKRLKVPQRILWNFVMV